MAPRTGSSPPRQSRPSRSFPKAIHRDSPCNKALRCTMSPNPDRSRQRRSSRHWAAIPCAASGRRGAARDTPPPAPQHAVSSTIRAGTWRTRPDQSWHRDSPDGPHTFARTAHPGPAWPPAPRHRPARPAPHQWRSPRPRDRSVSTAACCGRWWCRYRGCAWAQNPDSAGRYSAPSTGRYHPDWPPSGPWKTPPARDHRRRRPPRCRRRACSCRASDALRWRRHSSAPPAPG